MTQQGTVTITGYVGNEPVSFGRDDVACSFRIGSTRSYYQASSNQWHEHPTTWITVKAFRNLATNTRMSIHKGDPVIVTGVLNTEEWVQDGNKRSRMVVEASSIGHDLSMGYSQFTRLKSGDPVMAERNARRSVGFVGADSSGKDAGPQSRQQENSDGNQAESLGVDPWNGDEGVGGQNAVTSEGSQAATSHEDDAAFGRKKEKPHDDITDGDEGFNADF
ncbi:single-stranded DNA-binding protein [Bifidobacterium tsurumiense]|uniref:single-stranded DNA-binding protein n=1 Tax=Bifidobacterium tsurumiense TaxID=356829 RepID=UPI0012B2393C|nr:single-stranded DNA-binding protein [Bifidobacterium tsurumiense]MSS12187.1 single-stranded DNA-binding protein [Bifidobacterium tsurumiense]